MNSCSRTFLKSKIRPGVAMTLLAMIILPFANACQSVHGDNLARSMPVANAANDSNASNAEETNVGASESASGEGAVYTVECEQTNEDGESFCYVDRDTYVGWRTFHGFCHVCHAQNAVGSSFAPSLVDRMHDMDFELFVDRTANGYTGQVGVMPPWKDNPNVSKRYKELYAYLKARSDGALPPGRPVRKP
jgi:hypothetical protein